MPDSFIPPTSVRNAAKRGLALRQKYGRGGLTTQEAGAQGIGSGVQRASDLANGKGITLDTIKRMVAFFSRHEGNKNTPPEKGNGMISWLLWGGDAGRAWAESVLKNQESTKAREDAPNYRLAGPNLERCSTCRFFKARQCTKYKFTAQASYTCDAWRPNVEKSQALRDLWGKESEEQKEASIIATAVSAHGPGGLLSPLGLGKQKRKKRGAKTAKKETFDKASTQLDMPAVIKAKALLFSRSIDKTDLHENGIERDTHVTVKYGVNNNTLDKVKQLAAAFGPITLKFGKVSLFERPDEGFDVVKIEVESPELRALNRAISTLPNADTRKGYNPHLTIAYVKSGTGKKYVGDGPLMGRTRQQNAFRKANEIQLANNRLSNEHSRNNPAKGYYNASENKRRQRVQADLQNRMAELQKQQQAYQKIANPGMFKEDKTPSTFTVYKDSKGDYRWLAISSNAYRDKDGEIVSLKALQDDIARSDKTGDYGPLRFWHMPGVDIGDCDFNMLHGKMLIESGTFTSPAIAQKVARKASDYQMSIGFRHPDDEPDKAGVFHNIRRFERSLVPAGRAANPFTAFSVSEQGETVKHGSHNQASHGFRFGKAPSLTQARRYRKAGVLDEYSKRSRDRSGTKPAKARNAAKPKPAPKPTPKPAAAKPKRSIPDTKRFVKDRITALGGKKVSFKPMKDGRLQIVAQSERGTSPKGINAYINANGEIVRRDGTRAIGW